jgi:hypothetical protein
MGRTIITALIGLLLTTGTTRAGEDFYLLMFGSQRVPADPQFAHTFATFVRATWEGDCPCPKSPTLESHTISWLPCSGVVRLSALCPETGRNFGWDETIRWCVNNDMRISVWGAYRIDRELYNRAVAQVSLLESGQVRYQALDMGRPTDRVSNCIHAVSSLSQGFRLRVGTPGWGEMASYYVLKELEPWICEPRTTYPWVGSALGLDQYCLIYRDFESPRSGLIGPVVRLVGGERNLRATMGPPVR